MKLVCNFGFICKWGNPDVRGLRDLFGRSEMDDPHAEKTIILLLLYRHNARNDQKLGISWVDYSEKR